MQATLTSRVVVAQIGVDRFQTAAFVMIHVLDVSSMRWFVQVEEILSTIGSEYCGERHGTGTTKTFV